MYYYVPKTHAHTTTQLPPWAYATPISAVPYRFAPSRPSPAAAAATEREMRRRLERAARDAEERELARVAAEERARAQQRQVIIDADDFFRHLRRPHCSAQSPKGAQPCKPFHMKNSTDKHAEAEAAERELADAAAKAYSATQEKTDFDQHADRVLTHLFGLQGGPDVVRPHQMPLAAKQTKMNSSKASPQDSRANSKSMGVQAAPSLKPINTPKPPLPRSTLATLRAELSAAQEAVRARAADMITAAAKGYLVRAVQQPLALLRSERDSVWRVNAATRIQAAARGHAARAEARALMLVRAIELKSARIAELALPSARTTTAALESPSALPERRIATEQLTQQLLALDAIADERGAAIPRVRAARKSLSRKLNAWLEELDAISKAEIRVEPTPVGPQLAAQHEAPQLVLRLAGHKRAEVSQPVPTATGPRLDAAAVHSADIASAERVEHASADQDDVLDAASDALLIAEVLADAEAASSAAASDPGPTRPSPLTADDNKATPAEQPNRQPSSEEHGSDAGLGDETSDVDDVRDAAGDASLIAQMVDSEPALPADVLVTASDGTDERDYVVVNETPAGHEPVHEYGAQVEQSEQQQMLAMVDQIAALKAENAQLLQALHAPAQTGTH